MKSAARILIVDDETELLTGCAKILKALGLDPVPVANGRTALEILNQDEFDLILCDLFMPELDGMQVLDEARKLAPNTPVIIFSAYGTIERAVAAIRAGAFDFIEKPFEADHLKAVVEKGLVQRKLYCERSNLLQQLEEKYSFDNIIGQSLVMKRVFDMILSVAPSDTNVFISGESGTGKELVARSIHARGRRKTKAFVPVNCSAFPENLFEAELFGYEKGAFTGANQRRLGLLEFADKGTFFLDEVCELPVTLQAKLLRVLQDQQLRHIGGNHLITINVRFISASNQNLEQARAEGRLRDDFYYRLNVVNITIPPLRERKEDIPLLAQHFLQHALKSTKKTIQGFEDDVLQCFEQYPWPGNVRELENVVERAVTLATGEKISAAEIPTQMHCNRPEMDFNKLTLVEAKQKAIDETEKTYLLTLLKKYQGNVTKIAAESGMTRRNLHRLLNRHQLDANGWRNF
jgi:DNA-binding NtrC family response regulator